MQEVGARQVDVVMTRALLRGAIRDSLETDEARRSTRSDGLRGTDATALREWLDHPRDLDLDRFVVLTTRALPERSQSVVG
jgi:hypothetical protein